MSAFAERLKQVDVDLDSLGVSEERIAATRRRAHEAFAGDLGRVDELLDSLAKGMTQARPSRPQPAAAPAKVASRSTLDILADELEEQELDVEEGLHVEAELEVEAAPAPAAPAPSAKPALTESVLFGVSSLEGALDQLETEALALPEASPAEPGPADDLAALLEGDAPPALDLASLEEGSDAAAAEGELAELLGDDAASPSDESAPAPEEGEGEGDGDAKKGFFRKLFG